MKWFKKNKHVEQKVNHYNKPIEPTFKNKGTIAPSSPYVDIGDTWIDDAGDWWDCRGNFRGQCVWRKRN